MTTKKHRTQRKHTRRPGKTASAPAVQCDHCSVTVTWYPAQWQLPDSDTTVLIHRPKAIDPIWLGYHDGETWRLADGESLDEGDVIHWANLPAVPGE